MNISTSTIPRRRRKPNQSITDEEDASILKLGPEFDLHQINHDGKDSTLITLNLSETRLLINAALKQRRQEEAGMSGANRKGEDERNDDDGKYEEEDFSNSNEYVFLVFFFFSTQDYNTKKK